MKKLNQRILILAVFTCVAITSNAQVKTIHLSISQPNVEECITSIENTFKNGDIKIYPNPSEGVFTLEINNSSFRSFMELFVFDLSGKEVLKEEIWISESIIKTIDLSEYKKGTYIINIIGGPNDFFKAKLIIY